MDLDASDHARLEELSALSGEAGLSLVVLDFARSALALIPSCLAVRVAMYGVPTPITLTTPPFADGTVDARASLRLVIASAAVGGSHYIVFLAEDAGAFGHFSAIPHWPLDGARDEQDPAVHEITRLIVDADIPAHRDRPWSYDQDP